MENDRRKKIAPVPANLKEILTEDQLATITRIENFGGKLWFVRRPLFQTVVPVARCPHATDDDIAVIEEDGSLNRDHGLIIRDD